MAESQIEAAKACAVQAFGEIASDYDFNDEIVAHLRSIRQPDGIPELITVLFAIAEK